MGSKRVRVLRLDRVAVTIPKELVAMIDVMSGQRGMSRSKFISTVLREKVSHERDRYLQDTYDRVFSDESVRKEQLNTARLFEGLESQEGQAW